MVTYLSSFATAQIDVITSEVGTILTLIAPTEPVVQGDPFIISGELRRADTNALLSGETITAVFNGDSLGSDVTQNGAYIIDGVINDVGTYTITASFAGSERAGLTLRPSSGIWTVTLGIDGITPLMVGGIAALGVLLMAISLK